MESSPKSQGKKSLLMSLKSFVRINPSLNSNEGDPVLAYLAGANKDGVVLPAILSSTLSMAEDSRGENCTRKKVRDRWQRLKAALHCSTLMKKILSRRKSKKGNLSFSRSSKSLEREASIKISNPKQKITSRTNSNVSSASGFSPALNSTTYFSSTNSSCIDQDSDTSFDEIYSSPMSLNGIGVTKQKQCDVNETKKGHYYGSKTPLCMFLIISLLVLVVWGKFLAILCTSIWFYLVRPRQQKACNKGAFHEEIEFDSVQCKKRMMMEKLLERSHSNVSLASSSMSKS